MKLTFFLTISLFSLYLCYPTKISLWQSLSLDSDEPGYIYLDLREFSAYDYIYIIYNSSCSFSKYVYYNYTNIEPSNITSPSLSDFIREYYYYYPRPIYYYGIRFINDNNYNYLVFKYPEIVGESRNITCLSHDPFSRYPFYIANDIMSSFFIVYKTYEGYIYLKTNEFNITSNYINIGFITSGDFNSTLNYDATKVSPTKKETPETRNNLNIYNKIKLDNENYMYIFLLGIKRSKLPYIIFKYRVLNTTNIKILALSEDMNNKIPKYLAKNSSLLLSDSYYHETFFNRTGFIYLNLSEFESYDNFYIYFTESSSLNESINYKYTNEEPKAFQEITSLLDKKVDEIGYFENEGHIYCYKFTNEQNYKYLIIRYYGSSGKVFKVTSTTENPFGLQSTEIALIVIGSILGIGLIVFVVFFLYRYLKKKKNAGIIDTIPKQKMESKLI